MTSKAITAEAAAPYIPVDADFKLKNSDAITIDENFAAQSFWKDVFIRFFRKASAVIGLVLIILITVLAVIGPNMNEYTYSGQELSQKNLAPRILALEKFGIFDGSEKMSTTTGTKTVNNYTDKGLTDVEYWFGSDNFGRDIWTRTWSGARVSLIIAVAAAIIDMVIGMSRIARAEMLKLKEQEFVLASRTLGAGSFFIIFKEVLPNIIGPIITQVMFSIPTAIFTEAFLSFVGLGIPVPQCSLGSLISEGFNSFTTHPYQIVPPIVVMALLMLSFNLVADGLREALDPKMKEM